MLTTYYQNIGKQFQAVLLKSITFSVVSNSAYFDPW